MISRTEEAGEPLTASWDLSKHVTAASALRVATARLTAAGIEGARRDARLLLSTILPGGASALLREPEQVLSGSELSRFQAAIGRRAKREPVSRVVGVREFWSLPFRVSPDTLDPRPDSETLIEGILEWVQDTSKPLRILDLGTGTGCLLLALLSELPAACGLGVDISEEALAVARDNAGNLELSGRADFACHDWTKGLTGAWDIVLSNPPYITEGEAALLEPEVSDYDPPAALIAGVDGLRDYRILIPGAADLLPAHGLLALEVGRGQANSVEEMLLAAGLNSPWRKRDLSGVERCCFAVKVKK
ncbi:peptide chain release factor N(5)-glutamine methyltransferase [Denitrobaculum tricleocarpae]|uniref:Release factor glutamine methyltransferase n=1 Tax=Denitrobaculum tricleocarpae TaxID=2591009 RepID=A0A545T7L8_9PROT|nr:peptide chain release factor N(5)-glutamine methyltransferase [Denitrobaculum tricleocarpae]TQV73223.1 peptide chain release factor N(5)-glutamine methyltransferase [Denitrobaculum tricleocarpae]